MDVSWVKSTRGEWLPLLSVNLSGVTTTGVYAIWVGGGNYVRVGQGDIATRLTAHRNDPTITKYSVLYTTWAYVPGWQLDGAERYLYDVCQPLVGERAPDVAPISLNPLPGKS
jgi:hypothetical protein